MEEGGRGEEEEKKKKKTGSRRNKCLSVARSRFRAGSYRLWKSWFPSPWLSGCRREKYANTNEIDGVQSRANSVEYKRGVTLTGVST